MTMGSCSVTGSFFFFSPAKPRKRKYSTVATTTETAATVYRTHQIQGQTVRKVNNLTLFFFLVECIVQETNKAESLKGKSSESSFSPSSDPWLHYVAKCAVT